MKSSLRYSNHYLDFKRSYNECTINVIQDHIRSLFIDIYGYMDNDWLIHNSDNWFDDTKCVSQCLLCFMNVFTYTSYIICNDCIKCCCDIDATILFVHCHTRTIICEVGTFNEDICSILVNNCGELMYRVKCINAILFMMWQNCDNLLTHDVVIYLLRLIY